MGRFVIQADDPRRDDARRLLEEHRRFASCVMPPEGVHVIDPDNSLDEGDVTLFGLREDGQLLGIGAIKQLAPDHAELKSMHTAVPARSLYASAGFVPCGPSPGTQRPQTTCS